MLTNKREFINFDGLEYPVHHIQPKDHNCDLHIIAKSPDKPSKDALLIPVDKKFMIKNMAYFKNMFNSESNWEECKSVKSKVPFVTHIEVAKPLSLVSYMRSMYSGELEITKKNLADFHYIADYFQDDVLLPKIDQFVKENIDFINSIDLINYSDKFENEIEKFYSENKTLMNKILDEDHMKLNISYDHLFDTQKFLSKLTSMKIEKFIKILNIFKNTIYSEDYIAIIIHWIKSQKYINPVETIMDDNLLYEIDFSKCSLNYRYKLLNYCVEVIDKQDDEQTETGIPMKLYQHIIGSVNEKDYDKMMDENNSESIKQNIYMEKLKEMVRTVSSSSDYIKIEWCDEFSEDKPELKITLNSEYSNPESEDDDIYSWRKDIYSFMILPVQGVKSFTVINIGETQYHNSVR